KLDVSRSTIVDDMKVESVGPNKFAFNFENSPTETIVADGTDQPGLSGSTLAVKQADERTMTVTRKQDGKVIVSAHWKLSPDGRTLRDAFTAVQDDGSNLSTDYVYRRTAGTSGFAGAWESTTKPNGLKLEMDIQPYGNEGLSFTSSGSTKDVTFDGRDHAAEGSKDVTFSGRRRGARTMDYTEKNGGKVAHLRAFQLSRDGRTLTETLRTPGHGVPDVFVFQRTE
ncbi:MAG TPA: hypothetical protein VFU91_07115, partial [Sphingomicrobium sp.]|nr:hypothetical protein [Sphingomicrobium sp.]